MQTVYDLPDTLHEDLKRLKEQIDQFRKGSISATELRTVRVPYGVYEQREADTFMLRVRLPAGAVLPEQMRSLAQVSSRYGNGVLHVTTRQDIQIHRVLLDDVYPALLELYRAGLSTKGGGGNTVRNITGCHDAGVCRREAFDVTPYAVALTEVLLPDPLSFQLPRKYKIAFSGCSRDCSGATINDLGFIARRRGETLGFAVYVGGGMGARSRVGDLFEEFVPAEETHLVAEAIKRVFDKHGNRKNRHRARLRFLIERIGLEGFRELYEGELAEVRRSDLLELRIRRVPSRTRPIPANGPAALPGFAEWRQKVVIPQKQDGYFLVEISLWLGDIAADTLTKLGEIVQQYGEGMARTSQNQNLVLRWVHERELIALYAALRDLGLANVAPKVLSHTVACAGASTCKLGICLSRGLATAVRGALEKSCLDLDKLDAVKIQISGCPNACGRHPLGDIGLFGAARRVRSRLVPHYVFQLGGQVAEGQTRLADGRQAIPARNVPALLADLLGVFHRSPKCPDFRSFLQTDWRQLEEALTSRYREVPEFEEDENYYFDWGSQEMFSLAGRGPGECGAGVFDMIEVDLASAREAVAQHRLFDATVLAARSLLVTRGQEARDESEVIELFSRCFLDEKLVEASFAKLIDEARRAAGTPAPQEDFAARSVEVSRFVDAIQALYDNMDPSLRFKPVLQEPAPQPAAEAGSPLKIDREADLRGVGCPLNYVKTKMLLDQLHRGAVLSVLLDQEGAKNVPESVEKDGHDVLCVEQQGKQWQVVIRKT